MSTDIAPRKPGRPSSYTLEEIERGLRHIALAGGNTRLAAKNLKLAHGQTISYNTLDNWKRTVHVDRYEQIRHEQADEIHARLASEAEDVARLALELQAEALKATQAQLKSGEAKDPSTISRNLATTAGITIDKASLLRGKPTSIVENRDTGDILRSLAHKLGSVDSTAQEIADAEVVAPEQSTDGVPSTQMDAQRPPE